MSVEIKRILLLLTLVFGWQHSTLAQLYINEFMAANSSTIYDPQFNESADWIEIYNSSLETIDLEGYSLTDNISDTLKWLFPEGAEIDGNGYLIIWADGLNFDLHTSFKLSSAGEEIGLYDDNQTLLDEFIYSTQDTDISFGRQSDGGSDWSWFSSPTPGQSNNQSASFDGVTYFEPIFNIKGGFYSGQQNIVLSSLGGEVRYTLDGRVPNLSDPVYTTPIVLEESSFLRARVYEANKIPGPTITHTYFFEDSFEERGLPVISLVSDPYNFYDPDSGLYVQDFKPEWEHPVNIEFFENDGNNQAVFNERAGVQVNGLNSWVLPQKMLGIYFRGAYGNGKLDYQLFHDRDRTIFNGFVLRAGGSDWSSTTLRDGLAQSLVQENGFVSYQGFRQSIVFINGEYMGIHNIRSRNNDGMVEENYGMESGSYDIIENDGEVAEGTDAQYWQMDQLFNSDLSNTSNYEALSEILDIENFTDYWITEIYSSNRSWGHNVKLWKPHDNGKWQFMLADLDRGFSGVTDDGLAEFTELEPGNHYYNYARTWLSSIFENEEYAAYFTQRFNDHLYTSLHPVSVNKAIDNFCTPLIPEIPYHVERWSGTTSTYGNGLPTVEYWENEIVGLRGFAESRSDFMMFDLQSYFNLSDISSLNTSCVPNEGGDILINGFKIPEQPWIGPYFQEKELTLTAIPNPGYIFAGWAEPITIPYVYFESLWNYNDNGFDLGTDWSSLEYDDSSWASGNGEFGFGDGDENTVVSYGGNPQNKHITTYFRKTFDYPSSGGIKTCEIKLKRDDAVVVYFNGEEIIRNNIGTGTVDFETLAETGITNQTENNILNYILELNLLNGNNTIAVEIHQVSETSSDLSFDLSFSVITNSQQTVSLDPNVSLTLYEDGGLVALYQPTGECILPSEITENTNLTIDCSPYLASSDCHVHPNVSLTIDPGVEIWFSEGVKLIVKGDLQVNGTEDDRVIFKNNENDVSWGNITFDNSTAVNHLQYLEIENATKGVHPIHHRAAIAAWFSQVELDHITLLSNFSNPIYGEYADISLTNSTIHSDVTGDLINVKYGDGYISDCNFIGNEEVDTDAIDYDQVINGVIRNSRIENFLGFNSDGIDLGEASQNILVENCLINNCTDKGISIGQNSTAVIQNNTIVNCNLGLGIKDIGDAQLDHNTFYSNVIGIAAFEKNAGSGGGFFTISNSILSNSSESPISVDSASVGITENNFYDTDVMDEDNNQWMDPQFVNPTNYDFHLLNGSPAQLAATDGLDLGTLDHSFVASPHIMISDIQYFHPLDADREFIKILNAGSETVDLSGYTFSDAFNFTFPEGVTIAPDEKIFLTRDLNLYPWEPEQSFEWTSGQLANEGEKIVLSNKSNIVVDHVYFKPEAPWPITTLEEEHLTLIDPNLDNHFGTSWLKVEGIVGIEEPDVLNVKIYPNPAQNELSFENVDSILSYKVFDALGREVISWSGENGLTNIDISSLSPGFFVIDLNGEVQGSFVKE